MTANNLQQSAIAFTREMAQSILECDREFPIDLDDAWQWLGYNQKSECLKRLKNHFEEGKDFLTQQPKDSTGGRPSRCIMLTANCFKKLKDTRRTKCSDEEKRLQSLLQKKIGGEIEVLTPVGRIDLLTATSIIEIKNIRAWKSALGQLIVYHEYYPSHSLNMVLFGSAHSSFKEIINYHCLKFGIKVDYIQLFPDGED